MKWGRVLVIGILGTWGLVFSMAQDQEVNPFSRPREAPTINTEPPPQSTTLDTYEFDGIMTFGGETRISVFDTKEKRSYWLSEGEQAENGIVLRRYDPTADTVTISIGQTTKKLALKSVKIEELKISRGPMEAGPQPAVQPAVTAATNNQNGSVQESDADVRERMQKVAEEIRRRRAERRARLQERQSGQ